MLNYLDLRVVINGHHIYPLIKTQPVVAHLNATDVTLVVTDGFHITTALQVPFQPGKVCRLHVGCTLDDHLLLSGLLLTLFLYCAAFFTQSVPLQVLCFAPLLFGLYLYYFRRQQFLRVRLVESTTGG